ncbi:P-loop containing nucleoside triphosphate hydrolase protein [Entophlyctis helioformis]|nr:P-loop containing nucleoside triphosphate hydrolase protein [Entophlyctis helioformis]
MLLLRRHLAAVGASAGRRSLSSSRGRPWSTSTTTTGTTTTNTTRPLTPAADADAADAAADAAGSHLAQPAATLRPAILAARLQQQQQQHAYPSTSSSQPPLPTSSSSSSPSPSLSSTSSSSSGSDLSSTPRPTFHSLRFTKQPPVQAPSARAPHAAPHAAASPTPPPSGASENPPVTPPSNPSPMRPWRVTGGPGQFAHLRTPPMPHNPAMGSGDSGSLATDPLALLPDDQPAPPRIMTPRQIRALLDEHVIGQDRLKKALSVAVYHHYKRLDVNYGSTKWAEEDIRDESRFSGKPVRIRTPRSAIRDEPLTIDKSNVLLLGPTGSGKTLIAKTTAKILDVPFSMNDATPFTQAGYVGDDVEVCIHKLLQNADYDVAKAQRGIIFIDEIDKIARRTDAANPNQRDVSGEGVQQSLLRMLEGTVVNVTVKAGAAGTKRSIPQGGEVFAVDTSNILFICSGAFVGLEKIVQDRIGVKGSIGFGAQLNPSHNEKAHHHSNALQFAEPDDLIKYGFIPEFIGRMPIIASANPLLVDDLHRVLTEPRNALVRQYQEIFRRSNMDLLFHPLALRKMAEMAASKKTGARGLRRIMESVLQEALYDYPGTDVRYIVVGEGAVTGGSVAAFTDGQEREVCNYAGCDTLPPRRDAGLYTHSYAQQSQQSQQSPTPVQQTEILETGQPPLPYPFIGRQRPGSSEGFV